MRQNKPLVAILGRTPCASKAAERILDLAVDECYGWAINAGYSDPRDNWTPTEADLEYIWETFERRLGRSPERQEWLGRGWYKPRCRFADGSGCEYEDDYRSDQQTVDLTVACEGE